MSGTVNLLVTCKIVSEGAPAAISGPSDPCCNNTQLYTDATAGGTWSVTGSGYSITSGGVLTIPSTGTTATIHYTTGGGTADLAVTAKGPKIGIDANGPFVQADNIFDDVYSIFVNQSEIGAQYDIYVDGVFVSTGAGNGGTIYLGDFDVLIGIVATATKSGCTATI